ncbi:hypothetical protein HRbin10_01362 [bacterium HR10]|nr:hypothetical protein HRbin10_01362 [bacterium HR10]
MRLEGVSVRQQGDVLRLTLPRPDVDASAARGFLVDRLEVYRALEPRGASELPSEDAFLERARLIAIFDREELARASPQETLTLEDGPITAFGHRWLYAARLVDARGRPGPLSNIVQIEPQGDVPSPPRALRAVDAAQDVVLLTWAPPARNVDGSAPPNVLGYNVYRRRGEDPHFGPPLNGAALVTETEWRDRDFQYGVEYVYVVRAVAPARDGTLIESRDAAPIRFTPRDIFPPAPPEGVIAASAHGIVSLFWTPNREPDVMGYYIYRAPSADAPESAWVRLNATPHPLTTYRDEAVQPGARYAYRITAVDRFGNESRPSEIVVQEVLRDAHLSVSRSLRPESPTSALWIARGGARHPHRRRSSLRFDHASGVRSAAALTHALTRPL